MALDVDSKAKKKRDKAKEAIALALASRWQEAVDLNREIIDEFPRDVEAHNRLGKALSELGLYREAKAAFGRTIEISPANSIARKNLRRLDQLSEDAPAPRQGSKATLQLFIEERGKSGSISLTRLPPDGAHLHVAPGDAVKLRATGGGLTVESTDGLYLGEVEPKQGQRLARLMEGGNRYEAAVTSVQEDSLVSHDQGDVPAQQPAGHHVVPVQAADGRRLLLPGQSAIAGGDRPGGRGDRAGPASHNRLGRGGRGDHRRAALGRRGARAVLRRRP